jgi:hypothetical protein
VKALVFGGDHSYEIIRRNGYLEANAFACQSSALMNQILRVSHRQGTPWIVLAV